MERDGGGGGVRGGAGGGRVMGDCVVRGCEVSRVCRADYRSY